MDSTAALFLCDPGYPFRDARKKAVPLLSGDGLKLFKLFRSLMRVRGCRIYFLA